jgi:hypothetical protein
LIADLIVQDFQRKAVTVAEVPPSVQLLLDQRKKVIGDGRIAPGSINEVIYKRFERKIEAEYKRLDQAHNAEEAK